MPRLGCEAPDDALMPVDLPEVPGGAELFDLLPHAARRDLVAGLGEVTL